MLNTTDFSSFTISPFARQHRYSALPYYAGDIAESIGLRDEQQLEDALRRALKVCSALKISVAENFMNVYRYDGDEMVPDWRLSGLAAYLVIVNADPENSSVARAQLYFTLKNFHNGKI